LPSRQFGPLFVRDMFHTGASPEKRRQDSRSLNITFRYVDVFISLYSSNFVDHIYPTKLEIKDTTYTHRSALYMDVHLEIDS
jgi:hypothetical protein